MRVPRLFQVTAKPGTIPCLAFAQYPDQRFAANKAAVFRPAQNFQLKAHKIKVILRVQAVSIHGNIHKARNAAQYGGRHRRAS